MFLSLDLVGSTEFKQAQRGTDSPDKADSWVEPFLSFYQISVEQMAGQWTTVRDAITAVEPRNRSGRFVFGDGPEFWKGAGDEVLFTKIVRSPADAMAALHALLALIQEQRRQFAAKPQWHRLNVKGAAWLAGFPINNAEVIFPVKDGRPATGRLDDPVAENYRLLSLRDAASPNDSAFHADYIGPSVDLGFRLREYADPRRLVVSADLVWLLCHARRACTEAELAKCTYLQMPHIGYEGRHNLRGIMGGEPYPLMWVESDTENPLNNAEDRLLHRELAEAPSKQHLAFLWTFCNVFLSEDSPLRTRPYIPGCPIKGVGDIPEDHIRRLESIKQLVNGPAEQLGSLARADRGSGAIPAASRNFAAGVLSGMEPQRPKKRRSRRRRA